MIGFSVPKADEILIISYEGMHLLHFGNEITVKTDNRFAEYDFYDPDSGIANYQGKSYQIIGLNGGSPIIESPANEIFVLNTESETLSIVRNQETDFSMKYENFSGDWAAATFSSDGKYVVLGCPYDFDFVILEREDNV
jgi:hypothetical protein